MGPCWRWNARCVEGEIETGRRVWEPPGWLATPVTFAFVTLGWVFFRAADLHQSLAIIGQMFGHPSGHTLFQRWHVGLIAVSLALAVAEEKLEWFERWLEAPVWAYASALALMLFCLEIFGVIDAQIPFIYFQF